MELTKDIETYPGFCTKCGSILPPLSMEEFLKCYSCKTVFGPESKNKMLLINFFLNQWFIKFTLWIVIPVEIIDSFQLEAPISSVL